MEEIVKKKRGRKKGYVASYETRAKLSAIRKGCDSPMKDKRHTEESKRKNSEKHMGAANSFYNKKHTSESKAKMSLAKRNIPKSEEVKEKIRLGCLNRKKVKSVDGLPFESVAAAARYFQISAPCLRSRIRRGVAVVEYW